jgi:hypothetical protein
MALSRDAAHLPRRATTTSPSSLHTTHAGEGVMTLDRRQFLGAAAAGAALTIIGAGASNAAELGAANPTHPSLLAALGADTVREIGHAYRADVPAESTPEALEATLRIQSGHYGQGVRHLRYLTPASLRMTMEERVRADFAAGRVVVVRGWILSVTEARECALFSLLG